MIMLPQTKHTLPALIIIGVGFYICKKIFDKYPLCKETLEECKSKDEVYKNWIKAFSIIFVYIITGAILVIRSSIKSGMGGVFLVFFLLMISFAIFAFSKRG